MESVIRTFNKLMKRVNNDVEYSGTFIYIQEGSEPIITLHDKTTKAIYIDINRTDDSINDIDDMNYLMSIDRFIKFVPDESNVSAILFINTLSKLQPKSLYELIDKFTYITSTGSFLGMYDYFISSSTEQILIDFYRFISNPNKNIEQLHYYTRKELKYKLESIGYSNTTFIKSKKNKFMGTIGLSKVIEVCDGDIVTPLLVSYNTQFNLLTLSNKAINELKKLDIDDHLYLWLVSNNNKLSVQEHKKILSSSTTDIEYMSKIKSM